MQFRLPVRTMLNAEQPRNAVFARLEGWGLLGLNRCPFKATVHCDCSSPPEEEEKKTTKDTKDTKDTRKIRQRTLAVVLQSWISSCPLCPSWFIFVPCGVTPNPSW